MNILFILTLFLLVLLIVVGVYGFLVYRKTLVSEQLILRAQSFEIESEDHSVSILVLGDSNAFAVGADKPSDGVAGLLATYVKATYVENQSAPGTGASGLSAQVKRARLPRYTYILIQVGGKDMGRFHNPTKMARFLREGLEILPAFDRMIMTTAGNVAAAPFIPWFLKPFYTRLNHSYHRAFSKVVGEHGGLYVNIYRDPKNDAFVQNPERYFAADELHLSSEGYRLWFERILEELGKVRDPSPQTTDLSAKSR